MFGIDFCTLSGPLTCPFRQEAAGWLGWEKRVVLAIRQPVDRNKEMRILQYHGKIRYCGLLSVLFPIKCWFFRVLKDRGLKRTDNE